MPIEYKIYGCKFKCGHKHLTDYSDIEAHEMKCWYNADNKACMTCKHFQNGFKFKEYNYCELGLLETYADELTITALEILKSNKYKIDRKSDNYFIQYILDYHTTGGLNETDKTLIKDRVDELMARLIKEHCENWELKDELLPF